MDAETQEIRLARQRASVKWLLSKAFNNRVPDNLKEPFYRDHENQERLKPQIVVEMGNATLYCQTLSNLYSDPNYQSLNHWSILQTLARKGVPVAETPEMPLTETVLIQTNPLRINAHMSVIESLMILYAREISSGDRIPSAIRRISGSNYQSPPGQHFEQSLLSWISHACAALKRRISQEVEVGITDDNGVRLQTPDIPPVRDFQDLCDGVCLALLISYYCPKVIPWTSVRINYLPAVEDSIHNVLLVSNFSQKHLPYSVFHMTPEDVTYMRGSMKQNLIVLLADLFNLFEIHPAKCVCYPGKDSQEIIAKRNAGSNEYGICHRRGLTMQPVTPIPDLRSESEVVSGSPTNRPPFQVMRSASANVLTRRSIPSTEYQTVEHNNYETNQDQEGFVVHKSRGVTTLSSMHSQQHYQQQQEPLVPARLRQAKEKTNVESKADERGDYVPAGRPSNWEQNRRPSYAGRRSRRNSSSEDSQLTIENFGGSQDQLNMIGRSHDRDRDRDRERKLSNTSVEPAVAVRSSIVDARGTLQLGYDTDSGSEKQDRETEKYSMGRQGSVENISLRASNTHLNNISNSTTLANHKQHSIDKDYADGGDLYNQPTASQSPHNNSINNTKPSAYNTEEESTPKRKSSYGGNTAAWQQSVIFANADQDPYEDETRSLLDASKLSTIRMKLEEKRRRIEQDKHKIEMAITKHQEKIDVESSSDSMKWETLSNESKRTSDIDPIELEKYQQSIAMMNSNLQDIQQDIQRLATQQNQIQAQHLQAQQLIQAQHIANMLNQQPYGSQQHLAGHYQQRSMQQQQNFGSTPHLPQSFNSPVSAYNSRPPSRDPYQQQMQPQPIQYINEHGQYINQQSQPPQSMMPQSHFNMQQQTIYNENGPQPPYSSHPYGGGGGNQYQVDPHNHYQYPPQHPQPQYMNRPPEYDDYPPPHRGRDPNSPQPNPFYLHESSPQPQQSQRRTWMQSAHEQQQQFQQHQPQQQPMVDVNAWQSQNMSPKVDSRNTWSKQQQHGEFMLHQNGGGSSDYGHEKVYQIQNQNLFPVHSSPQHSRQQLQYQPPSRQHSMTNLRDNRSPNIKYSQSGVTQVPPDDMMAPQSICFIGDEEDVDEIERNIIETMQSTRLSDYNNRDMTRQQMGQIHHNSGRGSSSEDYENEMISNKLNITSGNLTYRIPSPSRPSLNANSFQDPHEESNTNEKGFYISFDDDQPKRPKPPLRAKRSPKKEKSLDSVDHQNIIKRESLSQLHNDNDSKLNHSNGTSNFENNKATYNKYTDPPIQLRQLTELNNHHSQANNSATNSNDRRHLEDVTNQQQPQSPTQQLSSSSMRPLNPEPKGKALVIGTDVSNLDPESVDEMERRKEKIMLLSLQRRQQQEEAKARKEIEANQRREREREKEEERARKKEEQMARRAAILEQHRLKKAIEEAEREGKTLDRELSMKQQSQSATAPRLRQQKVTRPRPKTIHVDAGSVDISEASSISSRGKKGSSTNLTGYGQLSSNSMRRDFYRGSQDSLTVKESPDEYPSTSSTPIGRRGSYKTSRGPKLYKQPAAKSNRGIILNAVEYCVFPGAVNRDAKQKVLEKIARSEAKHFLVLFRDAGCQFRALYSYVPETDQVFKLYGTGPSQVDEVMFDKFFKYNSGGKCFSQVHTKHLTVTIDAFTIHNSLWQGKKVHLPSKKDMALVI